MGETTFKKQFSNHKKSFNLNEYKNDTKMKQNYQMKSGG